MSKPRTEWGYRLSWRSWRWSVSRFSYFAMRDNGVKVPSRVTLYYVGPLRIRLQHFYD